MNEKLREERQAGALLGGAPEIGGRRAEMRTVDRMLLLEKAGNRYFGGEKEQGDIGAMMEILWVATRTPPEVAELAVMSAEAWTRELMEFASGVSMEELNEFGRYFEEVSMETSAAAAEPAEPGKPEGGSNPTGQPVCCGSG